MFQLIRNLVFSVILSCSFQLAADAQAPKHMYEVVADEGGNIAFMSGSGPRPNFYENEVAVTCEYQVRGKAFSFKREGYDLGGNPVIASNRNKVFLICMSVNLDYSKGSLDLAVFDSETGVLGPWMNVVETLKAIPDKPSIALNDNGVLALSYIEAKVENGISTSLKILRSSDHGSQWEESSVPEEGSSVGMVQGPQGNFTWSVGDEFYTSYSFYEKPVVNLIKSLDNASTFNLVSRLEHEYVNSDSLPTVTKAVLAEDGKLNGLLMYYGHSFGTSLIFPVESDSIQKPILISHSSTMLDARFFSGRYLLLETKREDDEVRTYLKELNTEFKTNKTKTLSSVSRFDEVLYYYGAYQSLANLGGNLIAYFIDYIGDNQLLRKEVLSINDED